MSEAAAKKAATAAKQAGHAVSNLETAAELQVEEVVQNVMEAVPFVTRHKTLLLVSAGFVGGAVIPPLAARRVRAMRLKREEKKAHKKTLKLVKDEERKAAEGLG